MQDNIPWDHILELQREVNRLRRRRDRLVKVMGLLAIAMLVLCIMHYQIMY